MKATAKALANHKELGSMLPADGGTVKRNWRFADAGINVDIWLRSFKRKESSHSSNPGTN
jgi:hypothetical protein